MWMPYQKECPPEFPTNRYGPIVSEERWPWLVTSALMLASAAAAARSTYLYWLPCRGTMLAGTIIQTPCR
jgi:hypothetical protein